MTVQSKQQIRQRCQQLRQNLSLTAQERASKQICQRIQALPAYQQATTIALYRAVRGEIDLSYLWHIACTEQKHCYYPQIRADYTLTFLPAEEQTIWQRNRFGILEPQVKPTLAIAPQQFDIMFLPVVAFDLFGTRIGMGAGYYDRYLAQKQPALLMGVAYEFQRQTWIAPEMWDIPLHAIITPQTIYWSK